MTITFYCPKCGGICAFRDQHVGKRARCTRCNERFIIPAASEEAKKVEGPSNEPVPGFYREVFGRSWKIFTNPASITPLVFVLAMVCFKFFMGHVDYSFDVSIGGRAIKAQLPIGQVIFATAWGCLFWVYMETIGWATYGLKQLPEINMGAGLDFIANVIKSIYFFLIAWLLAILPFAIIAAILKTTPLAWSWLLHIIMLGGVFLFPMIILIISTSEKIWLVFRLDYLVRPIMKAPRPYTAMVGLLLVGAQLQWYNIGCYGAIKDPTLLFVSFRLAVDIASTVLMIIAMHSIGVFYKHYTCYLPWEQS